MNRIYLVTFDGDLETRDAVKQFLDRRAEITDWHSSMSNSMFVVTDLDAADLRDLLRSGPAKRFIAVEVNPKGYDRDVSGFLPRATWDFIRRRQPVE